MYLGKVPCETWKGHTAHCREKGTPHPAVRGKLHLGLRADAELRLGDSCAHDASGGGACGDGVDERIHYLRATPLLVRERGNAMFPLLALDVSHVCTHVFLLVSTREVGCAEGI